MRNNTCGCGCHHYTPILIILFALLFLLKAMGYVSGSITSVVWPIIVGLGGIAKLREHSHDCC